MAIVKLHKSSSHVIYRLRDGRIVPGASTIAGVDKPTGPLVAWANKLGLKGIDSRIRLGDEADAGTVGHFLIECYLKRNDPDLSDFSLEAVAKGNMILRKFLEHWSAEELTMVASEVQLVSEVHGYGGTLDIVARDTSGRLVLVDIKSSKGLYESHFFQLAGYEHIWDENNEEQIDRRAIFRTGKLSEKKSDTEIKWMGPMDTYFDVFLAQLNLMNKKKLLFR